MANQELFKEAIAEARAIREAAISNAKEALEESLTPHLKQMLAAKLQEMEQEENEVVSEEEENEMDEAQGNIDAHEENPSDQLEAAEPEEEEPAEDESEESEDEAEGEKEEEEVEVKDMEVEDLKALIRDIISQELGTGEEEVEDLGGIDTEEPGVDDMVGTSDEEEIDLDELLAELDKLSEGEKEETTEEEVSEEVSEEVVEEDLNDVKEADTNELEEALETIQTLRNELAEVNLLNSKLLYVNKIFKTNNLTESQKANVISAFDKAETIKEVKLVFETISDNISNSTKKQSIKEHKSFASKATGTTAQKEVISEVSDQVRRMQKLAGIIK